MNPPQTIALNSASNQAETVVATSSGRLAAVTQCGTNRRWMPELPGGCASPASQSQKVPGTLKTQVALETTEAVASRRAAVAEAISATAFMAITWGLTAWLMTQMVAEIASMNGTGTSGFWNGLF